ncbi:MAG: hypothetical protein V4712_08350 [Pseudomonadota bacterium]
MTTRIEALRQLLFAQKRACEFLDRTRDDTDLKDALNSPSRLIGALCRAAKLTMAEVEGLADALVKRQGFVSATMNDVEAVRMMARY